MSLAHAVAGLTVFGLVATSAGDADAGRIGLARYLDRHDRTAARILTEDLARGEVDPETALALGDLAFLRRDFTTARRALELAAALGVEPSASSAAVWLAWVDFEAGEPAAAEARLDGLLATAASEAQGYEARFTLGWQQLLGNRPREAAATFAALVASGEYHGLAFPDVARLLTGQSFLFAGDLDAAEATFRSFVKDYPSSPVTDDVVRDLAWCRHLRGDDAAARAMLADLGHSYGDAHFASEGLPVVAWSTVVTTGPRTLVKPIWRAYRRRPRGEPPLAFLLRVGNRTAAGDARALLAAIDAGVPVVAPADAAVGAPAPAVGEDDPRARHAAPAAPLDAARPRTAGPRRTTSTSALLALLVLAGAIAAGWNLRRRSVTAKREMRP